jgi:anti-sigma factor RsiW
VIGHLGARISALLDGQLSAEEAERAWAHVHACHQCRDQVEREGWVKTRLAGLSYGSTPTPERLKGSLLGGEPPGDAYLSLARAADRRPRRNSGLVAIGGGALGAAVMGVLALGVASADGPAVDRRAPVTHLVRPTPAAATRTPVVGPTVRPVVTATARPVRRAHTP